MTKKTALNSKQLFGIVASNSIDYIQTAFQALNAGHTIVPLRTKDDKQRIDSTGLIKITTPKELTGWFNPQHNPSQSEEIAQIAFTSGTEGSPKGVLLSHNALNDAVSRIQALSSFNASAKEYIGVPVYHSFGYGRCRLIASVGASGFIPKNGFNPFEIAKMLKNNEINALSAVPSLLRILLENTALFDSGRENLRWIEIGSQPMGTEEKTQLHRLFPNACIIQHYGLTEASRTTLLRIDTANQEQLKSVGRAEGKTKVNINPQGRICIQGPHLASGLLIDGKVTPLIDESGWFETSDLGSIKDGFLYFEGRADNVINCGGQKISAEIIETELTDALALTGGVAITRIPDKTYGEAILLAKDSQCTTDKKELCNTVQSIMQRHGVNANNALRYFELGQLPITDTGKVQRKILADMYTANLSLKDADLSRTDPKSLLLTCFSRQLGPSITVQVEDSADSLGLDSISVVRISINIEEILGHIPPDFRTLSIADLANLKAETPSSENNSVLTKGGANENPKDIGFWVLIKEDFNTHERDFFSQGFWAVFNNRMGNWRMGLTSKIIRAPFTLLYRIHRKFIQVFCGIKLDYTVKLGRRVKLEHFGGMIIGAKSIGDDVTIRQNTTFGIKDLSNLEGKPTIEPGVNIGTGVVLVGDITIGRYSVIGPNTTVDQDVPPFSTVSMPPAIITTAQKQK